MSLQKRATYVLAAKNTSLNFIQQLPFQNCVHVLHTHFSIDFLGKYRVTKVGVSQFVWNKV